MLKTAVIAALLLCVASSADARHRAQPACIETGTVMQPSCMGNDFLVGVKSINVRMRKDPTISEKTFQRFVSAHKANKNGHFLSDPNSYISTHHDTYFGGAIARPIRYIAGRLVCAINLNAALAERGIRGTGSALAHSFDHWGIRVAYPVPGAVAVTDRRGGGHVALVSRVQGSRVFAWNPSPRGQGWREVEYTNRHARYRVAAQ